MRRLAMLAGLAAGLAVAAATGADRDREEAAAAEQTFAAELPRWHLTADGIVLNRPTAPVLRWTNPSAGRVYGNTYLWVLDGRPVVAGSMYRYFEPFQSFNGELAALTGAKLVARRDDKVIWRPNGEWKWHAVPGAAPPAASGPHRLAQMRELAGEFTVELLDTRNVRRGEDQTPRLLSKPLYRYEAERTKTLDGALFAFVLGTDPELLLLLECDTAAARPVWQFGVGRMNRDAIRLKRKNEIVWGVPALTVESLEQGYRFFNIGLGSEGRMR
jgi:hypothetical protein